MGYAVYDTVTGEVARPRVPTEHGLSTVDRGLVSTADSSTVVVKYGQWAGRKGSSTFELVEAWRPGRRPVPLLEPGEALGVGDLGVGPGGTVVGWRGRDQSQLVQISVSTGEVAVKRVERGPGDGVPGPPARNPAGDRIAFRDDRAMRGGGWMPALHVAAVAVDGTVGPVRELAPAWMPGDLLGWTDDRTLLARGSRDTAEHGPVDRILRYDVAAGTATTGIGLPPRGDRLGEVRVAADLLLRPLAEGREPAQAPGGRGAAGHPRPGGRRRQRRTGRACAARRGAGAAHPKQRTVLVLRYCEDLTGRQAAAAMGVRVGTIKSQTRHALVRLREVAPELAHRMAEPADV